jgi:hypothetical protein
VLLPQKVGTPAFSDNTAHDGTNRVIFAQQGRFFNIFQQSIEKRSPVWYNNSTFSI